jgi:hypothetical protein
MGQNTDSAPAPRPPSEKDSNSSFSLQNQPDQPEPEPTAAEEAAKDSTPGFWIFNRPPLEGTLSTDRPGFSDSFALVPRGYHHLESGYSFYYDHENGTRTKTHAIGEFSLRAGLTDWFELRIKWSGYSLAETLGMSESRWSGRHVMAEDHNDGAGDMSVGFKMPLLKQDGLIPNLSIIPAISVPTGSDGKTTGDVDPEIRLAYNYALTDKWSVYGVGLATWLTDGNSDGRFFQAGASLATYYQFTKNVGGFLEYYGLYPSARGTDCQHNIDFGPVFLINDNLQIDVRAGFGLNEEAPDFQAGIGVSYRF